MADLAFHFQYFCSSLISPFDLILKTTILFIFKLHVSSILLYPYFNWRYNNKKLLTLSAIRIYTEIMNVSFAL